jgi:hypothetical protein
MRKSRLPFSPFLITKPVALMVTIPSSSRKAGT